MYQDTPILVCLMCEVLMLVITCVHLLLYLLFKGVMLTLLVIKYACNVRNKSTVHSNRGETFRSSSSAREYEETVEQQLALVSENGQLSIRNLTIRRRLVARESLVTGAIASSEHAASRNNVLLLQKAERYLQNGNDVAVSEQLYSFNDWLATSRTNAHGTEHASMGDYIISVSSTLCYPYRPDRINQWFREQITRDQTAEPEDSPNRMMVEMINMSGSLTVDQLHVLIESCKLRLTEGDQILFHGTDALSAMSIINSGIDLTKSTPRQDFSNGLGFYVTKGLKRAFSKANMRAWSSELSGKTGAIIVFKICRSLSTEQDHLSLTLETEADIMVWENIVVHFQGGEVVQEVTEALQNMKFIAGPAAFYRFPYKHERVTPCGFTQTCIRDLDYARRFGSLQNICCVIFFSAQKQGPAVYGQFQKILPQYYIN